MWDYLDKLRRPRSPVYTVDQWSRDGRSIVDQIATSKNGGVAAAAYAAAVRERPKERITLRNGIRVVRSTDEPRLATVGGSSVNDDAASPRS